MEAASGFSTGRGDRQGRRAEPPRPAGDDAGALEELEFHWGQAYDIGAEGGAYTARRWDGKGAVLADALPEGLRLLIVADYERMPVPRDLP